MMKTTTRSSTTVVTVITVLMVAEAVTFEVDHQLATVKE